MFKEPTVILIGAGASAEFGLPTGERMHRDITDEEFERLSGNTTQADYLLGSFWGFLQYSNWHEFQPAYRAFVNDAKQTAATSIDLFAYTHPSHQELSRLYSAWSITKSCFKYDIQIDRSRDEPELSARIERTDEWLQPRIADGKRSNWLTTVINEFIEGANDVDDLKLNKLTFVTFNYDRIIEETFSTFLKRFELFKDAPDSCLPDVFHIHGAMDEHSVENLNPKWIREQSKNIRFIRDTLANPGEVVQLATQSLERARRVYSVGFAFEQNNADLLRAGQWGFKTVGLNFAGDVRVTNAMQRVGVLPSNIRSGSKTSPLFLGEAAADGFFQTIAKSR